MACPRCGADLAEGSEVCPSCGPTPEDAVTMGSTGQPSRPAGPIGVVTRRTPTPGAAAKPSSGWLSSSDSISHGRFAPGALLDGRYRIISLLGKGGMGEVYRADDLRLGQPVALKFLPEGLQADAVRLAQFHNEVRTARDVSHPNVCRVYDIGESDGVLYISMEFVDGEDLASSLRRIGRFPEDKAVEIARQLCAGLAAAHQRGIIHRDLKPANVMLDSAGRVRIMDFGLAAAGRVEDIRVGTPAYMAPEQLLGREVTARSDIFALGLVIYELFTGRRAFNAATVGELVSQHKAGTLTPPSTIVSTIDASVERAILRCVNPDPDRRPTSSLAVAAALPGGDPLAAALAAGETPSPEMVAAAGERAGLSHRAAWAVLLATLAGFVLTLVMALGTSPFDRMRPEYTPDVLAQKARDAIRQIGFQSRPADEAYGFRWNSELIEYQQANDKPVPKWTEIVTERPSPLLFWYRRSDEPLTGTTFHSDLLTPGVVDQFDPPPTTSGMIQTELDYRGRLVYLEAVPPQRQESPVRPAPVDWTPLFQLAGLDEAQLQQAEPLWNWLAGSDTRAAWTGAWPESGRPLRVEAAALGGRPVAFMVSGPWQKPWRMPDQSGGNFVLYVMLMSLSLAILIPSAVLARKNLREGRGDQRGAIHLARSMAAILLALWICYVHVSASIGLFATFLLAVVTSVFYGVMVWAMYLALEPIVRRHWPQVLISWTTAFSGRFADPVVGRDILIGAAVGVWTSVLIRAVAFALIGQGVVAFPGELDLLQGVRNTVGVVLAEAPYAIRNVMLYFFILYVMRAILRGPRLAAIGFTVFFTILNALQNSDPWVGALIGFFYFGGAAFLIVRWGLLPFAVGAFVNNVLMDITVTLDSSAWYLGNNIFLLAMVFGLAVWGFYRAVGGRIWEPRPVPIGNS